MLIFIDLIGIVNIDVNKYSELELRDGIKLDLSLEPTGNGTIQVHLRLVPTVIPLRSSMSDLNRRSEIFSNDQRDQDDCNK